MKEEELLDIIKKQAEIIDKLTERSIPYNFPVYPVYPQPQMAPDWTYRPWLITYSGGTII
jgi:hypothetical protein